MQVATLNTEHPAIKYRVRQHPLVEVLDDGQFRILTGPSLWGSGIWGLFPADALISVREPNANDSWPINGTLGRSGCKGETWTVEDLKRSIERARQR